MDKRSEAGRRKSGTGDGFRTSMQHGLNAIRSFGHALQQWVENRGRLTQFVLAAMVSLTLRSGFGVVRSVLDSLTRQIASIAENHLLSLVLAAILLQLAVQRRKFNDVVTAINNQPMTAEPLTDGGTNQQREDDLSTAFDSGTIGLGALAGALAGATLCSSFATTLLGPSFTISGAVFGILMGAIYGNDFVKSA